MVRSFHFLQCNNNSSQAYCRYCILINELMVLNGSLLSIKCASFLWHALLLFLLPLVSIFQFNINIPYLHFEYNQGNKWIIDIYEIFTDDLQYFFHLFIHLYAWEQKNNNNNNGKIDIIPLDKNEMWCVYNCTIHVTNAKQYLYPVIFFYFTHSINTANNFCTQFLRCWFPHRVLILLVLRCVATCSFSYTHTHRWKRVVTTLLRTGV